MSMTIAEPSNQERIQRHIDSGRFPNVDAVLSRALDELENAEKLRILRVLVAEADEDLARGDVYEITPTFWDELRAEAEEDDRLGLPISDHVKP